QRGTVSSIARRHLLRCLPDPIITPAHSATLNAPLMLTEAQETINRMPRFKAPGPDGFPAEFYHTFRDLLAPFLPRLLVTSLTEGRLPSSFRESAIVMLHKKGGPAYLANWRPISLINADAKLLSAILTARLRPIMPEHPRQPVDARIYLGAGRHR